MKHNSILANITNIIKQNNIIISIIIILLFGSIIFTFSHFSPLILDDYIFKYKNLGNAFFDFNNENNEQISCANIIQIYESSKNLYFHWSGRFFYHLTAYFFASLPKIFFNIFNALIASIVLYLIIKISNGKRHISLGFVISVALLFLLCAPAPGLTLFWFAGATNYLWSAIFYLTFLLPFRMVAEYGFYKNKTFNFLLILSSFITGLIGCNTNENTGGAVILVALLFSTLSFIKYRQIAIWEISGIIGSSIGFLLLIFAPGQLQRIAIENHPQANIFKNAIIQSAYLFQQIPYLFPLIILMSGIIFISIKREIFKKFIIIPSIFLIGGLSSCYVMIFSPYSPGRAMFGTFIFLLILWGILYNEILKINISFKRLELLFSFCLFLITFPTILYAFRDVYFTYKTLEHRRNIALKSSEKEIIFRPIIGLSNYNVMFKTDILSNNETHFANQYIAKELGLKKIKITPQSAVVGFSNLSQKQN